MVMGEYRKVRKRKGGKMSAINKIKKARPQHLSK